MVSAYALFFLMCVFRLCAESCDSWLLSLFTRLFPVLLWGRALVANPWVREATESFNKCLWAWRSQVGTPFHRHAHTSTHILRRNWFLSDPQSKKAPCPEVSFTPLLLLSTLYTFLWKESLFFPLHCRTCSITLALIKARCCLHLARLQLKHFGIKHEAELNLKYQSWIFMVTATSVMSYIKQT